ncbi:hypothetical protein AMELA_G00181980 [Ameiurus melas]|uniref:Thyroid transcription factor 1-associated protein 26 n=1 Tax=Ameiurus melas TaxID=219545 RepID=A0A7J6AA21_AMEME|nr:hypothetical protein AMELA_G00181980 [Ameiurus melas]
MRHDYRAACLELCFYVDIENTKRNYADSHPSAVNKKKKIWNPANKVFQGSLQEGKGFAFQRKQKVQQEYKKILRKEKWRMKDSKPKLEEEYPEHLRHLYLAEQQRLNEEEQLNKERRKKGRSVDAGEEEESVFPSSVTTISETGSPDKSTASLIERPQTSQIESSSGQDQLRKKKWKKMSSNQKMIEEYKTKKEERERKREEYLKDKVQREEALKSLSAFVRYNRKFSSVRPHKPLPVAPLYDEVGRSLKKYEREVEQTEKPDSFAVDYINFLL